MVLLQVLVITMYLHTLPASARQQTAGGISLTCGILSCMRKAAKSLSAPDSQRCARALATRDPNGHLVHGSETARCKSARPGAVQRRQRWTTTKHGAGDLGLPKATRPHRCGTVILAALVEPVQPTYTLSSVQRLRQGSGLRSHTSPRDRSARRPRYDQSPARDCEPDDLTPRKVGTCSGYLESVPQSYGTRD
jgi:hypothetical protein